MTDSFFMDGFLPNSDSVNEGIKKGMKQPFSVAYALASQGEIYFKGNHFYLKYYGVPNSGGWRTNAIDCFVEGI